MRIADWALPAFAVFWIIAVFVLTAVTSLDLTPARAASTNAAVPAVATPEPEVPAPADAPRRPSSSASTGALEQARARARLVALRRDVYRR